MDSLGIKITAKYNTMMGDQPCEIYFDNVENTHRASSSGEEGEGFGLGQRFLAHGRLKHGARGVGTAQRCSDMMCTYAKQRETFGQRLVIGRLSSG